MRYKRFHASKSKDDRQESQRDRDRLLYSSAFRRLAGVTQVIAPGEGHVFHNRLTHSLKVAQIARRLAERILSKQSSLAEQLGVDPDVCEAAALAHDLGHPPFGHVAEKELDRLVVEHGLMDGFEGNAQSFRIVNSLSVHKTDYRGLNLTRATLNGILKYPWFREPVGDHSKKWGVYLHTEGEQFRWARELFPNDQRRSAEAEVMNFADDVAYAIHDAEDFYRAGLIPLDRLRQDSEERRRFLDAFEDSGRTPAGMDIEELGKKLKNLLRNFFPLIEPYVGTLNQRASLRTFVSLLVGRYVKAVKIQSPRSEKERRLRVSADMQAELKLLQFLTWHYM